MEIVAENSSVHGRNCIGCKTYERDIMLSFLEGSVVHDVFLTQEQANALLKQLTERVKQNAQGEGR